jgi:hypothetical protein
LFAPGLLLAALLACAGPESLQPSRGGGEPFEPTAQYAKQQSEGWTVRVSRKLQDKEHAKLREKTLQLLGDHLYRISRAVPEGALAKLREIPVWVELAEPHHECMCYHPSRQWLLDHGMNPDKARSVEIANAENFLDWERQQPWMVLHELAHGYHQRVLGPDHPGVRACYDAAVASKSYESVLHWDGQKVRAYALCNPEEYFAEGTEAFFGTNDFYPFVRAELKRHDPRMHDLLEQVWGVRPAGAGRGRGRP